MSVTRFDMINQATQQRIATAVERIADQMDNSTKENELLLAIQAQLDGVRWTPDTLDEIARLLVAAGYPVRNVE